ncbi:MAG TPA: type II toxin-antitoxin system Phd/YefM family antitoxin [Thermomicrobiales bacterium]|jgi:PHD/YefM family antitoxin component YafN of YafNO toxin-antitoxin module
MRRKGVDQSPEDMRMVRTISVRDAERDFAAVLSGIEDAKETIVVDEVGKPVAVFLSPEEYRSVRRERAWSLIHQVQDRNADQDPDDVLREVTDIVEEVRQEQHDRARAAVAGGS